MWCRWPPCCAVSRIWSGCAVAPGSADFWRIDWRNFFTPLDPDHPPQHALRLSGGIAPMFGSDFSLPEGLEIHSALVRSSNDLALRDLVRSMDGGLQTVAALVNYLEPALRADHPDWALWQPERRRTLIEAHCASWAKTQALQVPLAAHLIADPPLYLYLLAEAGAEGQPKALAVATVWAPLGPHCWQPRSMRRLRHQPQACPICPKPQTAPQSPACPA